MKTLAGLAPRLSDLASAQARVRAERQRGVTVNQHGWSAECDTVSSVPQGHTPFAVFNRTANPAVTAVLSSPMHPLLSRRLALITVAGRRSGRRYTFPVGYRQTGDRVIVDVGWPERKQWWRNLCDGGRVQMRIRGHRRDGQALARGDERTGVTVEIELEPRLAG